MDIKSHCDIETGEIHGCEEGSFKWWHEKGHLVFNKDSDKSFLLMVKVFCFDAWMLAVMVTFVFNQAFPVVVFSWLAYIGIGFYEEWWCNEYAKKQLNIKK